MRAPDHEPDLLQATAELVAIPSVSRDEAAIVAHLEGRLRRCEHLEVARLGNELVARTRLGRPQRVLLAGHTDTVPPAGNEVPRIDGDRLTGLGSVDMKGGLAVMAHLAETVREPLVDVSYVFYSAEEIDQRWSGLGLLARERPELLRADAGVLAEPTGAVVEAGCQGTLRVAVELHGLRAHTARPWRGRNALHRLAPLLEVLATWRGRQPVVDGCTYRESLQAVGVEAGVAGNVVPDRVRLVVNHRFAPDRSAAEAEAAVRELFEPWLEGADSVELLDAAAGAKPGLAHPILGRLVAESGLAPRAKLGWTDVARLAALGIPAVNLGPGDPELAHSPGEHVERSQLERVAGVLRAVLVSEPAPRLPPAPEQGDPA